jgi:hypothetical protein
MYIIIPIIIILIIIYFKRRKQIIQINFKTQNMDTRIEVVKKQLVGFTKTTRSGDVLPLAYSELSSIDVVDTSVAEVVQEGDGIFVVAKAPGETKVNIHYFTEEGFLLSQSLQVIIVLSDSGIASIEFVLKEIIPQ